MYGGYNACMYYNYNIADPIAIVHACIVAIARACTVTLVHACITYHGYSVARAIAIVMHVLRQYHMHAL